MPKKRRDTPAYPLSIDTTVGFTGMTKREAAAVRIIAGLAAEQLRIKTEGVRDEPTDRTLAIKAWQLADALFDNFNTIPDEEV